jgi:hypothetical protein
MELFMRKLLGGLIVTSALLASFGASASVINNTSAITFTDGAAPVSGLFSASDAGKTFSDNFTFTIGSTFDVSSAVVSINSGTSSKLSLSGLTLTGPGGTTTGTSFSTGGVSAWSLSVANLVAGNYTLTVLGSVLGSKGGSFGGVINTTSAVPEADSYAMMLAGLGLVGFMAYRRKSTNTTKATGHSNAALCA